MPKKIYKDIKLPLERPDCCFNCPLLGLIPNSERRKGSQEILLCLGTFGALSQRKARSKESEHTTKHPLKRPCVDDWERWHIAPYNGKLPIEIKHINRYRDPFVRGYLEPTIIFSEKRGRKPQP